MTAPTSVSRPFPWKKYGPHSRRGQCLVRPNDTAGPHVSVRLTMTLPHAGVQAKLIQGAAGEEEKGARGANHHAPDESSGAAVCAPPEAAGFLRGENTSMIH